jgi:hypothetical protein
MARVALIPNRQVAALRGALSRAVDRVEDEEAPAPIAALTGPQAFRATLGGRTCRVVPYQHRGTVYGARVIAPAANVPFELRVTWHRALMSGLPRIGVGDAAFEDDFRIGATQPELARIMLDAETRRRISAVLASMSRFGRGMVPYLAVGKGCVEWFVPVRKVDSGLLFPGETATPADLRDAVGWTFALADRVGLAFERVRVDVASRGGPQAAAAWVEGQHAAIADVRQTQRRSARILLGGVLGCLVIVPVLLVAIIAVVAVVVTTTTTRGRTPAPARR